MVIVANASAQGYNIMFSSGGWERARILLHVHLAFCTGWFPIPRLTSIKKDMFGFMTDLSNEI